MKWLLNLIEAALGLFLLAIAFIIIILYKPDWSPFQPTVGTNITVLSSVIMAFGTLFLAYATFRLIQHSSEQEKRRREEELAKEKREREERLLNEIIEWATDIAKKPYEKDFRTVLGAPDLSKVRLSVYGHIGEVKESLLALRGKSQYITEVARKFEPDLKRAIAALVILFIGYIELLDKWQKAMASDIAMDITDRADEADAHWSELAKAAYKVIEEATKIKTKDIG